MSPRASGQAFVVGGLKLGLEPPRREFRAGRGRGEACRSSGDGDFGRGSQGGVGAAHYERP